MASALAAIAACDSSVRVGELREDPPRTAAPNAGLPVSPSDASPLLPASWKLHAPLVPCTIYAIAEVRADEIYLGCNGGRIYRYDGVAAQLAFEADEKSFFSLMWAAPDGQVWAGAQSGVDSDASTQLYHFQAGKWTTVPTPAKRVVSIAGVDSSNVWIATEAEIQRFQSGVFVNEFTIASEIGAFRECTFAALDMGWCVGTGGLAVAWDGVTWSVVKEVPWSTRAEVFGVELDPDPLTKRFFVLFAEPSPLPNKQYKICNMVGFENGKFVTYTANFKSLSGFDIARRRTGTLRVGTSAYLLLSLGRGEVIVFDPRNDTANSLSGRVLALGKNATSVDANGGDEVLAGGDYGFLARLRGASGPSGSGLALTPTPDSNLDFIDLSVAPDGAAWARVRDNMVYSSVINRFVRFEDVQWKPVPAPARVLSGRGLGAAGRDRVYTIDGDSLLEYAGGVWTAHHVLEPTLSLSVKHDDDVWIGGDNGEFGHFDGKALRINQPRVPDRRIEQILGVDDDVWAVGRQSTVGDAGVVESVHLTLWSGGRPREWDVDDENLSLSGIDASHVWRSGKPAAVWDGSNWKPLGFDASAVWARAVDEIYFVNGGDISRWNGRTLELVFHGLIPISRISGSRERAFAVGPGGLTIEFARLPRSLN